MDRPRFDVFSFLLGLVLVAVGVVGLTGLAVLTFADLRLLAPGLLVIFGVALVVSAARRGSAPDESDPDEQVPAGAGHAETTPAGGSHGADDR